MPATASKTTFESNSSLASITLRIFSLFGASGKLTINLQKRIPVRHPSRMDKHGGVQSVMGPWFAMYLKFDSYQEDDQVNKIELALDNYEKPIMVESKMTLTVVRGDHIFHVIIYNEFILSHSRRHGDLAFPLILKAFFFYILAHLNSVSPSNRRYK